MMTHKKATHISLISGIYYYVILSTLFIAGSIALVWQLESDTSEISLSEFSFLSTKGNRNFYIPASFCNAKIEEFEIERFYFDTEERVYYSIPNATFSVDLGQDEECYTTRIYASTGSLRPGEYEYRVNVKYKINPIQETRKLISVVHVTVE